MLMIMMLMDIELNVYHFNINNKDFHDSWSKKNFDLEEMKLFHFLILRSSFIYVYRTHDEDLNPNNNFFHKYTDTHTHK